MSSSSNSSQHHRQFSSPTNHQTTTPINTSRTHHQSSHSSTPSLPNFQLLSSSSSTTTNTTTSSNSLNNFNPIESTLSSNPSRRSLLTAKAINLSSRILTKSANYLSSKDLDQLAHPLFKANHKVNPSDSSSSSATVQSWKQWDNDTSNWHMQVGGHRLPDPSNSQPSSSTQTPRSSQASNPSIPSSSSGYLSYFNRNSRERRSREAYTEENLVCFPGVSVGCISLS